MKKKFTSAFVFLAIAVVLNLRSILGIVTGLFSVLRYFSINVVLNYLLSSLHAAGLLALFVLLYLSQEPEKKDLAKKYAPMVCTAMGILSLVSALGLNAMTMVMSGLAVNMAVSLLLGFLTNLIPTLFYFMAAKQLKSGTVTGPLTNPIIFGYLFIFAAIVCVGSSLFGVTLLSVLSTLFVICGMKDYAASILDADTAPAFSMDLVKRYGILLIIVVVIVVIARACASSPSKSYSSPSSSEEQGYWGSDGYYHSTEQEREQAMREAQEWMLENW